MDKDTRHRITRRTSYVNALVNSALAFFKIGVGWIGHSSALIADGLHSLSDLISDVLVLIASKAGTKHPDEHHPYGHHRIETIASILIALLFLSVGIAIIWNAALHLLHQTPLHTPSIAVVVIAFISIIANEYLFRYTLKKGQQIQSNLLITNAWHNRTDVFVSLIVLLSVVFTLFGLTYFDSIGAGVIAVLILKIGIKMIWENINELIDAGVDEQTLKTLRKIIQNTPGVQSIHQLRTRRHGGYIFVDVHVLVAPRISVSEGHYISEQVHLKLSNAVTAIADVTVHIDPEDDELDMLSVDLPPRAVILSTLKTVWQHLPGYTDNLDIQLHYLKGKVTIELKIPLALTKTTSPETIIGDYESTVAELPYINRVELCFIVGQEHEK